jgi:NADH-quinone oxidoreductase subunit N
MLNNFVLPDFLPAAPELLVAFMAMLIMFVDLFVARTQRWIVAMLTVVTLLGAALLTLVTADGQTVLTFSNMFVDDLLSDFLKLMTYLAVLVVIIYSRGYLAERGLIRRVLCAGAVRHPGMMVMISAANCHSVSGTRIAVTLCTLGRPRFVRATSRDEILVLGALASVCCSVDDLWCHRNSGLVAWRAMNRDKRPRRFWCLPVFAVSGSLKLGAVPFHMWIGRHGATAVTLFLGSAPKLAALRWQCACWCMACLVWRWNGKC